MKNLSLLVIFFLFIQTGIITAQTVNEGLKYLENENFTAALNTFTTLASKEPTNPIYHYYIGEVKYQMEDFSGAEKSFADGLKINSKCAECAIGLGKIKLDNNKAEEAQALFDGAIKSNKKSASILALVGNAYLTSKNPSAPKALEYLIKSRDMDPKAVSIWSELGKAYMLNDDFGNAMSSFETAVDKNKNNLDAYIV